MANVAKDFAQLISQSKSNKTGPYDTQATVKRVEGNTVWVSIPGGVDETPIDKTVNCTAGDKVQVRVSGGRAWITGNASAPPTDDTTAIKARTTANEAQVLAVDAKETADAVEGIAVNASATAVTAKTIAEGVNEHFWHDNTGAHVTEVTQEEWNEPTDPNYHSGGNTLITTQGMAIRNGLTNLAEFGASGQKFNNEYSHPVLEIGKLPASQYNSKGNWTEYNGLSPWEWDLPWNFDAINSVKYYDSTYSEIAITPTYTINGRKLIYDATACTEMQNNSVQYLKVNYNALGEFPFFTIGSDGLGDKGVYSYREGENTVASGPTSHAEGDGTIASGTNSHAEGSQTQAISGDSHAEGLGTIAGGLYSHAEGFLTETAGSSSHAEGWHSTATGNNAHAEGVYTEASGTRSHAQNNRTVADKTDQTAIGTYNTRNNTNNLFVVGNGTADNARSDAFEVDVYGNVEAAGDIEDGSGNVLADKIAKGDFVISSHTTTNKTISGGSTMSAETQTFTKTGYYPLAISGWLLNGSNATNLTLVHLYISSQASGSVGVTYRIHNAGSSQSTSSNVRVYILWVKEN